MAAVVESYIRTDTGVSVLNALIAIKVGMDLHYDENLLDNIFFRCLQKEFSHVLEAAPTEKWTICVPRKNSFNEEALASEEFVLAHILGQNDELPESHFQNINGKYFKMVSKSLIFTTGTVQNHVAIMFEEIFYTKNLQKYRVWCIEKTLCDNKSCTQYDLPQTLESMDQALKFCFSEIKAKTDLQKIEQAVKYFIKKNLDFLMAADLMKLKCESQLLYNHCLDICLSNPRLSELYQEDAIFANNMRVAVEYYMMNVCGFSKHLFNGITVCCVEDSEQFNKSLLAMTDLSVEEFQIDGKFTKALPEMTRELAKIDEYIVAADKLNCLKRALNSISQKYSEENTSGNTQNLSLIHTIDELLPIFIYAIIKSNQTHWLPTLHFVKHFRLNNTLAQPDQYFGADDFLVTTLEATVMYILDFRSPKVARLTFPVEKNQEPAMFSDKESYLNYLFHHILANDEEKVAQLLRMQQVITCGIWSRDLCHPLCDCCGCAAKITNNRVTVNTKNPEKLTAIHVTAMAGHAKLVTVLLSFDAKVNVRDRRNFTPLHYAAQNGHQNTLLLLLHAKAAINVRTDKSWTPLHLACGLGHESCAKAILYFADHMNIHLDVNAVNEDGRTALHLAALWGFQGIVEALLEYGSNANIADKANNLPVDYAHNKLISKLLIDHAAFSAPAKKHTSEQLNRVICTGQSFSFIDKLSAAIANGDNNLACFFLEIEPNNSVNKSNEMRTVTCHPLCNCELCNTKAYDEAVTAKKPIDINNILNSDGLTPLHLAAYYGNTDFLSILMDHRADTLVKTKAGKTCLHLAVEHGKWAVTKQLLTTPNSNLIDIKDSLGDTALHYAVKQNNDKLVGLILSYKPNLNLRNSSGRRPIDLAKTNLQLSIVKMLETAEAKQKQTGLFTPLTHQ